MTTHAIGGRVYGSGVAEVLDRVQSLLDEHIGASAGRCMVCGLGTCQTYLKASRVFAWSGHLPHRTPGATLPAQGAATRFGWLAPSDAVATRG
jgi:hypothetical protein